LSGKADAVSAAANALSGCRNPVSAGSNAVSAQRDELRFGPGDALSGYSDKVPAHGHTLSAV